MRILVDTQIFLWLHGSRGRVSAKIMSVLEDPGTEVYVSAATAWEIAIKVGAGKLRLPVAPQRFVEQRMAINRMTPLPIELRHGLAAGALPPLHRDPFDRVLIAQARLEDLTLLTADEQLAAYDVRRLAP